MTTYMVETLMAEEMGDGSLLGRYLPIMFTRDYGLAWEICALHGAHHSMTFVREI